MGRNEIRLGLAEGVVAGYSQVVRSVGIGSCVAISLHDSKRRIGGVAHVMLPESANVRSRSGLCQCAETAVATLLDQLRSQGACQQDVVAKLVGGAKMFAGDNGAGIGKQNILRLKH